MPEAPTSTVQSGKTPPVLSDLADASFTLQSETGTCVFIESRYSGDVQRHVRYLLLCNMDAVARGEMPVSTHGSMTMHPVALNYFVSDFDPKWDVFTRAQAISRGNVLRRLCEKTVFYVDLGMSRGMLEAKAYCEANKLPYEVRTLDVSRVLAFKAEMITQQFVEAILDKDANFYTMLRSADTTIDVS